MHNSATVHRMRMQSSALDSSRSQLCNDTSTGVVRHQITKRRRLQKVVSYDVLHHIILTNDSQPLGLRPDGAIKAIILTNDSQPLGLRPDGVILTNDSRTLFR